MSKTALVTGNLGFVGSWLTLGLLRKGYRVVGLDNRSSLGGRMADTIKLQDRVVEQASLDVCDHLAVARLMEKHNPEIVLNLAGQAIVPRAFREPFETYRTNTLGTVSVLEAARLSKIPRTVVCITSDKVYQNNDQIWPFRENDQLGGKDIYSVSKSSAELVCQAYAKTHFQGLDIQAQSVRLGNVVGGGDWSINRLIPDLMNALVNKTPFNIRYPNATRPFQHVLDVVDGIVKIAEASSERRISTGEGWNLGPRNNTVAYVHEVVALCKKHWPQIDVVQEPNQVVEDLNLSVEVAKFKAKFGAPHWTSEEAIERAILWYDCFFKKMDEERLINEEFTYYESEVVHV